MNSVLRFVRFLAVSTVLAVPSVSAAEPSGSPDPVSVWREGVRVAPVSETPGRHTIHSYYVCNPESPDGRHVLFYSSADPAGHVGEIRILNRQTGHETVLAEDVHTEDAHRAACQQWLSDGRRVAFHEVAGGRWQVAVVDVATRRKTVIAEDRQLGFGRSEGDLLPLYGCHWNPGGHRDLELWDATTGELRTALRISDVERQYADWLTTEFKGKSTSIFFPVISPDQSRVFFKMAAGNGGDNFMAKDASHRQGLISFDLERRRFTMMRGKWGHPAWHPDSLHIIEMGNLLLDSSDGSHARIPDLPNLRGSHPSASPDGRLMVTDGLSEAAGGPAGEWGIMVGDLHGRHYRLLHSFDNARGARSWRRSHPHPVFSGDGRRIYYNVSDGEFTRLFVAEAALPSP